MRYIIYIILFSILIGVTSCQYDQKFPIALDNAIDYFYVENKNDTVIFFLNKLHASNKQTEAIGKIIKAGALCELGKIDSALSVIEGITPNKKDKQFQCWYNSIKGLILFRKEKFTESYECLISASSYDYIDKRTLALNERIIARILFSMEENKQAIEYLLLSNKHFDEKGLEKSVAVNHKILGRYYMRIKNYSQAFDCFKKAEYIFKKYQDNAELFYVYINLVDYFIKTDNFYLATSYLSLCNSQCKGVEDNQMRSLVNNNLGELATKQKKYADAIHYSNATLDLSTGYTDEALRRIKANINLSETYNLLNNKTKAQFYAKQAKMSSKKFNEDRLQYVIYKQLAESYLTEQSKSLSYLYLDTANQWLDSALSSASKTSKAFYDAKVDLMKSEIKIDKIQTQEKRNRNIFIFISTILFAIVIFIFVIYKIQNSKNKILKELVNKNLQIIEEERTLRSIKIKEFSEIKKPKRKPSDTEKLEQLFNVFIEWIENNKTYRRKDLTLDSAAKQLNTNREYLSRSINEKGIRFIELINKYRIEEAIFIISDIKNKKSRYNLSIIASEVGFNSDSVFIDAFKKQTGLTPNQFRENLKSTAK